MYDLADLFYPIERLGRRASWSWRRSLGPAFVPFAYTAAISGAAAAYFVGDGYEVMRELLLAPSSVSNDLFTRVQLERRLTQHRKALSELPVLGVLICLELWRSSLLELRAHLRQAE